MDFDKDIIDILLYICTAAAVIGLIVFASLGRADSNNVVSISNEETSSSLSDNPERGFYSTSYIKLTEDGCEADNVITKSTVSNLLFLRVDLSEFSGAMNGLADKELTHESITSLNNTLEEIKQNNNSVVLRFVYDSSEDTQVSKVEPEQEMILKHVSQLEESFQKYSKIIDTIQVGFYGRWGECYSNTDIQNNTEYFKEITEALLYSTRGTDITIALRTPRYYSHYKGIGVDKLHTYITEYGDLDYRVGIYNDGIGGNETDLGTYMDKANEFKWIHAQARHTSYGGEAVIDADGSGVLNEYNNGMSFIDNASYSRLSYLNYEWNQLLHEEWKKEKYTGIDLNYKDSSCYDYINSHMGYRFLVKEVICYDTAVSEDDLLIGVSIKNVGFGNMVKRKRADVILTDEKNNIINEYLDVSFDARELKSKLEIKEIFNIKLPSLNSGTYKLYLRLSNGELLENGKYHGAVKFANKYIYNETLEANYIAQFTI